jgi:hypothetical protein
MAGTSQVRLRTQVTKRRCLSIRAHGWQPRDPYRGSMSSSGKPRRFPITSRIAVAGAILGIASVAVGVIIVTPIANRSASDDSLSSQAVIFLVLLGLVAISLSAVVLAGGTVWRRVRRPGAGGGQG